jgi:phosphocarrier protein
MCDSETVMEKQSFTIKNRLGLHARAAALLVQTASRFQAEITVAKDGETVNGKSIMGILMLAAAQGSLVEVAAQGKDASQALNAIAELIENGFGEN